MVLAFFKSIVPNLIWFGVYYALAYFFGGSPLFLALLFSVILWLFGINSKNNEKRQAEIEKLNERIDSLNKRLVKKDNSDQIRFKHINSKLNDTFNRQDILEMLEDKANRYELREVKKAVYKITSNSK